MADEDVQTPTKSRTHFLKIKKVHNQVDWILSISKPIHEFHFNLISYGCLWLWNQCSS